MIVRYISIKDKIIKTKLLTHNVSEYTPKNYAMTINN